MMQTVAFTKTLDCGALGEIECDVIAQLYTTSVQRVDDRNSCSIVSVSMCINGIKHDIMDELSEELLMELQEEAWEWNRQSEVCAAEAHADALREDRMLETA